MSFIPERWQNKSADTPTSSFRGQDKNHYNLKEKLDKINLKVEDQEGSKLKSFFNYLQSLLRSPNSLEEFKFVLKDYYLPSVADQLKKRRENFLIRENVNQMVSQLSVKTKRKIIIYLNSMFKMCPDICYKTIIQKPEVLEEQSKQALCLYKLFLRHAGQHKNERLLKAELKSQIESKLQESVGKLIIVLSNFKKIEPQIEKLITKINEAINQLTQDEEDLQLLQLIQVFVSLNWNAYQNKKPKLILQWVNKCIQYKDNEDEDEDDKSIEKSTNDILEMLDIKYIQFEDLRKMKNNKLKQIQEELSNNRVRRFNVKKKYQFLKIITQKVNKQKVNKYDLFQDNEIQTIIQTSFKFPLYEEIMEFLDIIKNIKPNLNIQGQIFTQLQKIINPNKSKEQNMNEKQQIKYERRSQILVIKALGFFNIQSVYFDKIYNILKNIVMKNTLYMMNDQYKKETLKVCFGIVTQCRKQFKQQRINQQLQNQKNFGKGKEYEKEKEKQDKRRQKREIQQKVLSLTKQVVKAMTQDTDMKKKIIELLKRKQYERFYKKKLYNVFAEPQFLHALFQDYSSPQLVLRRFSIKILCQIYDLNKSQILPFLKQSYIHLFQRLTTNGMKISIREKVQNLKIIRDIICYRTDIIVACQQRNINICDYLYKSMIESNQDQSLFWQILKTLKCLIQKMPNFVYPLSKQIVYEIIKLMEVNNFLNCQIKTQALRIFNQIIRNNIFVIIPYFYFFSILDVINTQLKSQSCKDCENQLMVLLGNLGYIAKGNYMKKIIADNHEKVIHHFQKLFKPTQYTKEITKCLASGKINSGEMKHIQKINKEEHIQYSKTSIHLDIHNYRGFILKKILNIISFDPKKASVALKILEEIVSIFSPEQQQKFQQMTIKTIIESQSLNLLTEFQQTMLSLLYTIIKVQDTKSTAPSLLQFLLSYKIKQQQKIEYEIKEKKVVQMICILTEQKGLIGQDKVKQLVLWLRQLALKPKQPQRIMRLIFKTIENICSVIDKVLHLFFSDFCQQFLVSQDRQDRQAKENKIKTAISQRFLELIITLSQHSLGMINYLPLIVQNLDRMFTIEINKEIKNIQFIQKIINFITASMIIFGDKFLRHVERFHSAIKGLQFHNIFYKIAKEYLRNNYTLNNLQMAFKEYQLKELFKKSYSADDNPRPLKDNSIYNNSTNKNGKAMTELIQHLARDHLETPDEAKQSFQKLVVNLMLQSSDPLLKFCSKLANEHKLFLLDIFPITFYFGWIELPSKLKPKLITKLEIILEKKQLSLPLKQQFLEVIYYMEQRQCPININLGILRDTSKLVLDRAKALYYAQKLAYLYPQTEGEKLILMYSDLGEYQSVSGQMKISNLTEQQKIRLFLQMHQPQEAKKYMKQLVDKTLEQNQILNVSYNKQLSKWDTVMTICKKEKGEQMQKKLAHLAVESSLNLGLWEDVKFWLQRLPPDNQKYNLWQAMLHIQLKKYDRASQFIKKDREIMYPIIGQLFNFSFQRKMSGIARLQQLCELEQSIQILKLQETNTIEKSQKKRKLIQLWNDRIIGCSQNLQIMFQILMGRSLLLKKKKDSIDDWLNLCKLALKKQQVQFCQKVLVSLIESCGKDQKGSRDERLDLILEGYPDGKKKFQMSTLLIELKYELDLFKSEEAVKRIQSLIEKYPNQKQLNELYYNCARWMTEKQNELTSQKCLKAIDLLDSATKIPSTQKFIKGYRMMGLMHLKILDFQKNKKNQNAKKDKEKEKENQKDNQNEKENEKEKEKENENENEKEKEKEVSHNYEALWCFIESVCIGTKKYQYFMESCLKIMNIIFNEDDSNEKLIDLLQTSFMRIPCENLIYIVPQIIGRLDDNHSVSEIQNGVSQKLLKLMKELLIYIGTSHPQSLLFPLLFLQGSYNEKRSKIAREIIDQIFAASKGLIQNKQKIKKLFYDGYIIVNELCKFSLKINQRFLLTIQKHRRANDSQGMRKDAQFKKKIISNFLKIQAKKISSSQFFHSLKNKQEIIRGDNKKAPLSLDLTEISTNEFAYLLKYRQDLKQACTLYEQFIQNPLEFQLYLRGEKIISKIITETSTSLKLVKKMYLNQDAVILSQIKGSQVCIPGTYNPINSHHNNLYIDSFENEVEVINSKQRPKKLVIRGQNGKTYRFLLKGKEDLRLDEKIMQLISLINKMFDYRAEEENYTIQGYSITPLSSEAGLIGWVQKCETLAQLIIRYRRTPKQREKLQKRLGTKPPDYACRKVAEKICDSYALLSKLKKVQIYREVDKQIPGNDLKNIFFIKTSSSEQWLRNRSCFTRSLAVMSIVGYVIGLGDRHPNNIMIQEDTGRVVHIDYGDCFDICKMRDQYPQKVPFRLTRMLVQAMEPCGVQGIFKKTSLKILELLKNNKQQIITIIEALKYDPLIGWKLTKEKGKINVDNEHQYDPHFSIADESQADLNDNKKQGNRKSFVDKNQPDFADMILSEIKNKLSGKINDSSKENSSQKQVEKLIEEATSPQNLVQHYQGWAMYW